VFSCPGAGANGGIRRASRNRPESPRFTHLSVGDGPSQSSVLQILQDRKGLLWFGTQEGLNRYDGYRFTVHRARDQDGFLRDHDITAMIESGSLTKRT
jgi:ligand-binding sensor domain-containing protein